MCAHIQLNTIICTSSFPAPPSSSSLFIYLFFGNIQSQVSSFYVHMAVGLLAEAWESYQWPHP